jgi:isoleucyl-tRNA synthetase
MATEIKFDFPDEEKRILDFWETIKAFETSVELNKNKPTYSFFDGPPFATGLPHYGHILAGTIKDIVLRYASQNGFHVPRRFGWDCHGLPVEYEIDKLLGISGREDIEKMGGVAAYNAECRKIVSRYTTEWEVTVKRMGRWIDFKNDYKTMYPDFMESVWWVFKTLFTKGQIYRGFKVMPFSTACMTPLSNFELALNYKDVNDPSIVVLFPLVDGSASLMVWTTTPWTLPSNLAIALHPNFEYAFVESNGKTLICLEAHIPKLFKTDYKLLKKCKGSDLVGKKYEPIFDFYTNRVTEFPKTFTVVGASYVSAESGTGLVHNAPGFGEDDYNTCLAEGIITDTDVPCPVNDSGKFLDPIVDYKGVHVKTADSSIIKAIEAKGRLFNRSQINHSYPFCWRSDTPLIYRAVPCWFVRVKNIVPQLIEASQKTYWVPESVQEKRFHNWLAGAHDWAISRNRYWGNPIPVWASDDYEELVCIGSVKELEELSGVTGIKDLHRESIDHIRIPSKKGKGELKRVDEVLDCWFESGAVPYASQHYPFENLEAFKKSFPADFIGEGLDQTRGWFYTLVVLGTHLFGQAPFKNLIVNGLVLAADGKKMSKRLKNYPEPSLIFDKYGADALRLYLINSPVVKAENLRFSEDGVRGIIRDVMLPWLNAFKFMESVSELRGVSIKLEPQLPSGSSLETFDKWILSAFHSLVKVVREEMTAYKLYAVVPPLLKFIESLTNWYIRFNRKRLKGDYGEDDAQVSFKVLHYLIFNFNILMAPFAPFFSESVYQRMKPESKSQLSVHFLMFPEADNSLIDLEIERAFSRLQLVVERVRTIRESKSIVLKVPLKTLIIKSEDKSLLDDLKVLEAFILEELNIHNLELLSTSDKSFSVKYVLSPNFKSLGAKLKGDLPAVQAALKDLGQEEITEFKSKGSITVCGHCLSLADDINVNQELVGLDTSAFAYACEGNCLIIVDIRVDDSLQAEGFAREFVSRIQRLRKEAGLKATDSVDYVVSPVGKDIPEWLQLEYITKALKQNLIIDTENPGVKISCEYKLTETTFGEENLKLSLYKRKN